MVAGPSYSLQKRRNRAWGGDLTNQVDVADIDAQFQRCGGDEYLQVTALEPLFGIQTLLLGQAAVVGCDALMAQALAQVASKAFGQASGVDEYQRGAMRLCELGQTVVDQFPDIVGHYRSERHRWHFYSQVARPRVADVDDRAGPLRACKKLRNLSDGLLRGRQADAAQRADAQGLQPLQAQGQMAASFAAGNRMDFVDDHRAHLAEHAPTGIRAE